MTGPRLAVNPIAYWLVGGRNTRTLGPALTELAELGYTAVKADVPDDLDAEKYLSWLESFGMAPAISLFPGTWDDASRHAGSAVLLGIEHREMPTDRLVGAVALDALRADVPGGDPSVDIQLEDGIVDHRLDEAAIAPLALQQAGLRLLPLRNVSRHLGEADQSSP